MTTQTAEHRMVHQGKGSGYWAQCSCGRWAWLGRYKPSTGRRQLAKADQDQHVDYEGRS